MPATARTSLTIHSSITPMMKNVLIAVLILMLMFLLVLAGVRFGKNILLVELVVVDIDCIMMICRLRRCWWDVVLLCCHGVVIIVGGAHSTCYIAIGGACSCRGTPGIAFAIHWGKTRMPL